jgi:hypothetical protein
MCLGWNQAIWCGRYGRNYFPSYFWCLLWTRSVFDGESKGNREGQQRVDQHVREEEGQGGGGGGGAKTSSE